MSDATATFLRLTKETIHLAMKELDEGDAVTARKYLTIAEKGCTELANRLNAIEAKYAKRKEPHEV